MPSRALSFILVVALLDACAQQLAGQRSEIVRLTPDVSLVLPPPAELGRSLEAVQLVIAHYRDRTIVLESHISATPERVLLIAVDALGRRALTLTWSDDGIDATTAPWLPEQFRSANMLADMVVLYWPDDSVRRALAVSGVALATGPGWRAVKAGGKELIRAEYGGADPWNGRLTYRNLGWNYALEVQSVETAR